MSATSNAVPTVAIVGRPNVGKSLLFNKLCGRRAAIVHDAPGMTLDYLSETATLGAGQAVRLLDTGGVRGEESEWSAATLRQMEAAAEQADVILLVTDSHAGLQHADGEVLAMLRRKWRDRPRILAVNKSEGKSFAEACADFYSWKETMLPVSAKRGGGLAELRRMLSELLPPATVRESGIPLAIVGRPNVGKSTLMNALLKTRRTVVSNIPGTTRDNIRAHLSVKSGEFLLVDTAGMRRRRAEGTREKFSVAAARSALQSAEVVLLMWDMSVGASHQDRRIASMIADAGCGVVLAGNKCDLLPKSQRASALRRQAEELAPGCEAKSFAISATGGRVPTSTLLLAAAGAARAAQMRFNTAGLNRALSDAVRKNPPPMSGGIRPKLRYIHQGGQSPLRVVIHGGGVARIAADYRRYLSSALARSLSVVGAPLRVEFRAEENPYVR